jgi:hypothetical protein
MEACIRRRFAATGKFVALMSGPTVIRISSSDAFLGICPSMILAKSGEWR